MLVDIMELKRIDPIRWHFLPDSNSGSIPKEAYRLTYDVVCIMHKQPTTVSKDDMISIEWAASVFRKDTSPHKNKRQTAPRAMDGNSLVLSVSIERDDLRSLAETAERSCVNCRRNMVTHGYFGPLRGRSTLRTNTRTSVRARSTGRRRCPSVPARHGVRYSGHRPGADTDGSVDLNGVAYFEYLVGPSYCLMNASDTVRGESSFAGEIADS
jgi:hypothetical protein